jgi:hypothetical protein
VRDSAEAIAFGKPVVLVNGDSHYFRIDKPYMRLPARESAIENVTRVETFGSPITIGSTSPPTPPIPRLHVQRILAETN